MSKKRANKTYTLTLQLWNLHISHEFRLLENVVLENSYSVVTCLSAALSAYEVAGTVPGVPVRSLI